MKCKRFLFACAGAALLWAAAQRLEAQVTPAEGYTPPDDTPKIAIGVTIFADYSYQDEPSVVDGDKVVIHRNAFTLSRAYLNVTGSFNHWISFRVTPDIRAETGSGSTLSGNQTFRIKYGYAQVNFDDFLPRGSWFRFGLQQTPYVDSIESIYRYRFAGTLFAETEGFITSADYGVSTRLTFPQNYGDFHIGLYNGDGYQSQNDQTGVNGQKALQVRASVRPAPGVPILRGLRISGFYDSDRYFADAKRDRFIGNVTFENPYVNAGFEYLDGKDRTSVTKTQLNRDGYSIWVMPRTPIGVEGYFRYDHLNTNKDLSPKPKKNRTVVGIAFWPKLEGGKTVAVLADYSEVKFRNTTPDPGKTKIYSLHTLFNF